MLFDVAAVFTSVALGPVAEAFGVHEITAYSVVGSAPTNRPNGQILDVPIDIPSLVPVRASVASDLTAVIPQAVSALTTTTQAALVNTQVVVTPIAVVPSVAIPDAPPVPFIGPEPAAGPVDRVQATRILQQLALLTPSTIGEFIRSNPEVVTSLLAAPPPATDVTFWWKALDPSLRVSLRTASPELIGNLDGIPYSVRDTANRAVLGKTMASLEASISSNSGRTVVESAKQQLHTLQAISDAATNSGTGVTRTLMTLDVTGQGRAAIVLGDLRTADYVTYLVPGMFFTIENQMGDWVDAASRLYDEQSSWLALLDSEPKTVATVAWIGYHTPNLTNVGGIENAQEGSVALASAIEGLQSTRTDSEPYVTVVAHSYGATAALIALTDDDFQIDALALVGSPGSPAQSVRQLHVKNANVFVGEAAWDPVPNSSYFGSDPGAASYGAKPMGVGGGVDSLTKQVLAASVGHNAYFLPGTESMRNFALIGIDKGQYVTDGTGTVEAAPKAAAQH